MEDFTRFARPMSNDQGSTETMTMSETAEFPSGILYHLFEFSTNFS